jgi:hypothetical protein
MKQSGNSQSMQPFPEKLVEIGVALAGVVGLLILIAPTFGVKPRPTADGWRFPVKPTCLLLYYLALCGGMAAVALSSSHLLAHGVSSRLAWAGFAFGFLLVPLVLADWPEPLVLDGRGLLEGESPSSRILWQELNHVREYRIRCDHGFVVQGTGGKQLVVADIAYDAKAVLAHLLQWRPVPYYSLRDDVSPLSTLSDHQSQ